jgi:hypothetical protein
MFRRTKRIAKDYEPISYGTEKLNYAALRG